ncbi:hypothetical protein C8R46DRAFT_1358266 [Mycena filopes]|nr:hypothetical protein C8R46DRAFT_1358266 [Mycena filopes]
MQGLRKLKSSCSWTSCSVRSPYHAATARRLRLNPPFPLRWCAYPITSSFCLSPHSTDSPRVLQCSSLYISRALIPAFNVIAVVILAARPSG